MTVSDILRRQSERACTQLESLFSGIQPADADFRVHDRAMSIAEMATHLCECYQALLSVSKGEIHEWGTYTSPFANWDASRKLLFDLRREAMTVILSDPEERLFGFLSNIIVHDSYHIGQLTLTRLALDPDWIPTL